jgi:hypothetical protein
LAEYHLRAQSPDQGAQRDLVDCPGGFTIHDQCGSSFELWVNVFDLKIGLAEQSSPVDHHLTTTHTLARFQETFVPTGFGRFPTGGLP